MTSVVAALIGLIRPALQPAVGPLAAILLAVVAFLCLRSYMFGAEVERGRQLAAMERAAEIQHRSIKRVQEKQIEREVIYRDRIKRVYLAQDPSGCIDERIPDDVARLLGQAR